MENMTKKIKDRLNNTEPIKEFHYELENKNILHFWNILQLNNKNNKNLSSLQIHE